MRLLSLLSLLCLLLVACNGSGSDDDDDSGVADDDDDDITGDDDDDDTVQLTEPRGACELAVKVGSFEVQHETDYSMVYGVVADGVVPTTILENVGESGSCRLLRRNNPFCDPPCDPGFTCDHNGECIPYPNNMGVGTVDVFGLAKDVSMEPSGTNEYYDTVMPHPAFEPGSAVRLEASGGDYAGFTLYGQGVSPVDTLDKVWVVRDGQALDITWTPADQEYAEIHLRLNIDQHGNSPVELVCDVPDSGSASIPGELTDALMGFGITGFPAGQIYRRTVDKVEVESGCVEFEVYSHLQGNLQVEGHIPCAGPDDCPEGMECDIPTGTCI